MPARRHSRSCECWRGGTGGSHTFNSVILFLPSQSSSKPDKLSRFSISYGRSTHVNPRHKEGEPTLILLAASSRFLNVSKPSRFSIFCILFCTKYRSLSSFRWLTFLICLILLKLRSSAVRCNRCSRPRMCEIRLS